MNENKHSGPSRAIGVEVLREFRPSEPFAEQMAVEGVQVFSVFELEDNDVSAAQFLEFVVSAKKSHGSHGACLHTYQVSEYRLMRLFTDQSGEAGFAIKGSEVVSVFSHKRRPKRKATRTLMTLAASLGGRILSAFDTALPVIYALARFIPVAKLCWDDREAPADWDFAGMADYNDGRPDVVFMAQTNRSLPVPYVSSYDEAVALQRSAIDAEFREVEP